MARAATYDSRATPVPSQGTPRPAASRVASFDFLKTLAIFGVVCIHTTPFRGVSLPLASAINDLTRFAVPYFFIVSGYFFARRFYRGDPLRDLYGRTTNRLLLIFVIASAAYLLEPNFDAAAAGNSLGATISGRIAAAADHPVRLLLEGTKPQLWFLVSLAMGLSIFALLAYFGWEDKFFYIAVPLYESGILAGAYSGTPIGFHVPFNTRDGPFFSAVFIAVGAWLARTRYRPSLRLGIGLTLSGLLLHGVEAAMLSAYYGVSPFGIDYVHGTALYGIGVAFLALALPDFAKGSALADWGRLTLGVYVVHFFAIDLLGGFKGLSLISWQLVFPASVFLLALALTRVMAEVPILRRAVT